jgi:amino acid transporter
MIASLLIANSVAQYARKMASAGAFYTYTVAALGPVAGFLAGWMVLFGYAVFEPSSYGIFGNYVQSIFASEGIHVSWWVFALGAGAVITALSIFGILESLRVGLVFLIFEAVTVLVIVAFIFGHHAAPHHLSLAPFKPSSSPTGWHGIFLGAVWGMFGFIGFEGSATLGEETRLARRFIPIAVIGTVVVVGLYYILVTYAESVAWGTSATAAKHLAASGEPWVILASRYLGTWGRVLVYVAGTTSILGVWIAIHNSVIRIAYGMGRSGVLPRQLGRTHRRFRTPWVAILVEEAIAVAIVVWVGIQSGPLNIYGYTGVLGTLGVMVMYALINVGIGRFYWLHFRKDFNIFVHALIPAGGLVFIVIMEYEEVVSNTAGPYRWFPYLTGGYLLLGLLIALWYRIRRPALLASVATELGVPEGSVRIGAPNNVAAESAQLDGPTGESS